MLFSLCFMLLIVMCLVLEWKVTSERNAMNGEERGRERERKEFGAFEGIGLADSDSFFDESFLDSQKIHENKRLMIIFENIENYDGTSARQKEVI